MDTKESNDVKLSVFSEGDAVEQGNKVPEQQLPLTGASAPKEEEKKIWPGYIIATWIALSSAVIIQNAWILRTLEFNYPIFLTTFHLAYATLGTRLLKKYTHLLDGLADVPMSWDRWARNIVPIGALFSGSLIFNNLAYITLSVSFIQMLKAFNSVAVLSMSVAMGLDTFDKRKTVLVCLVSLGVALASYGEINFALTGFIYQCIGILFEATRLVAIQKLLRGLRMDPLVSLYYYAPVCASLNLLLIPFFEGVEPFYAFFEKVGSPIMILNATTAFALNVAVVFLIGSASSLVLTLSGVLKDILLVTGSMVIFGSVVTSFQAIGYGAALLGLFLFKTKQEVIDQYIIRIRTMLQR